jgi:hypothetical protein
MPQKIPFLTKEAIAASAGGLLNAYWASVGSVPRTPVPVEEILEQHLRLSFGFADLRERFGGEDVLGALWVEEREVLVDERLDPDLRRGAEPRLRFTLAHEIGHWELHRHLLARTSQIDLLGHAPPPPSLVCRSADSRVPIEWQADRFAADLLMPAQMVREHWLKHIGRSDGLAYEDFRNSRYGQRPPSRGLTRLGFVAQRVIEAPQSYFFEQVARVFAPSFGVSIQAMRIRLEDLGLLSVERTTPRLFG